MYRHYRLCFVFNSTPVLIYIYIDQQLLPIYYLSALSCTIFVPSARCRRPPQLTLILRSSFCGRRLWTDSFRAKLRAIKASWSSPTSCYAKKAKKYQSAQCRNCYCYYFFFLLDRPSHTHFETVKILTRTSRFISQNTIRETKRQTFLNPSRTHVHYQSCR